MIKARSILEPLLGLAFLVVAGYFGYMLYQHSERRERAEVVYKADFDTVDGLTLGTSVKINGVPVGHVTSIALDKENFSAIVSFVIEKGIVLSKDTVAMIVSESLLGGKVMTLIPGSEEQILAPGSTIYSTQSSVNFEGLLQKFLFGGDHDKGDHNEKKDEAKPDKEEPKSEEKKVAPDA